MARLTRHTNLFVAHVSRRSLIAGVTAGTLAVGGLAAFALVGGGSGPVAFSAGASAGSKGTASTAPGPSTTTGTNVSTVSRTSTATVADRALSKRTTTSTTHRPTRTVRPDLRRPSRKPVATQPTVPSPTGTQAASCAGTKVWSALAACGWPGPGNTGYPSGTTLKASGALVITKAGTVVDGLKVSGGIQVRAKNVVIRNSSVSMSAGGKNGSGVININPGASATIERTTINGQNATHSCIWHEGVSMKASKINCSGVNDGIFMWATTVGKDGAGDNFTIQDSWLHGFTTNAANGHVDGIQTEGAKHGVIRHNTIDVTQSQTSAISLWNSRKSTDDVLVDHNLIAGGGFSIYAEDYSPSESSPAGGYSVTNVRITNNVFSTVHFGCVGYWGVWFPRGAPTDGWHRSGNVVWETGAKVDKGNPTYKGSPCN